MDCRTYELIRAYCWQELAVYINTPFHNQMLRLCWRIDGPIAEIEREGQIAIWLRSQCKDLTPRERAAAHLLAVTSYHRAVTWQRENETPDGRTPAAPLEPRQITELWQKTRHAVSQYAPFIPEREALTLLAAVASTHNTATPAPVATVSASVVVHSTKARRDALTPVIELAQRQRAASYTGYFFVIPDHFFR